MNEELEKILEEIKDNFEKKVYSWGKEGEEPSFNVHEEENNNYVVFHGEFKEKARSMKELKPLFDYIEKKGYKTNLD